MSNEPEYDVAIIGAGINGAGIARDAATRGLKVLVIDKNDMCSGTSAVSSRLIHGGLRYLEYAEIPLVFESLHERRCLRVIAKHLVKPIPINIPIYKGARRGRWLIRLGMIAYDLLSFGKRLPRHDMLSRTEIRSAAPALASEGLVGAARYHDAQVTFAERLVLENLIAARAAGADVKTYCELTDIKVESRHVRAVEFRDRNGQSTTATVRCVVNAAGPWVDQVLQNAPGKMPRLVGGTKGSHIIVDKFDGAPADAFYVEAAADGRPFFIIPWNEQVLIGTTDIRYDGSLDRIRASAEEIEYLVSETNRVFPGAGLQVGSINYAYAGVRPLPHRVKGPESAITRRHIIKINRTTAKGLISIIGGKLTTYRNLAEQTVDKMAKVLRTRLPECRTRDVLLPGSYGMDQARGSLQAMGDFSPAAIERLLSIYGGRAGGIAELAEADPELKAALDEEGDILVAEVVFVVREEFAVTLSDIVFRRTMLGFNRDQGRQMYQKIADCAAVELGWTVEEKNTQLADLEHYARSLQVG